MRRDALSAIPRQAVEDACAAEPDAVLARDEDAADVDRAHGERAVVHALERRRDLDDVAPQDALGQDRARAGACACVARAAGGIGQGGSCGRAVRRGVRRGAGMVRVVRERRRPRVGRESRERREVRLVQRLRAGVEVVHEDDGCEQEERRQRGTREAGSRREGEGRTLVAESASREGLADADEPRMPDPSPLLDRGYCRLVLKAEACRRKRRRGQCARSRCRRPRPSKGERDAPSILRSM